MICKCVYYRLKDGVLTCVQCGKPVNSELEIKDKMDKKPIEDKKIKARRKI